MRAILVLLLAVALVGCRGEPVPPDYQNTPTMTAAVDDPAAAPAPQTGEAAAEPDATAEGTSAPYEPASAPPPADPPPDSKP